MRLRHRDTAAEATPVLRDAPTAPVTTVAPSATAALPETTGPLERRGVRVAALVAALLAVGAVTLPITTGMSAGEWLRTGNLRAAYRPDNLRFVQAMALARLGMNGQALDVATGIASNESRDEVLALLFPRFLAPWQPERAFQSAEATGALPERLGRLNQAIEASLRHDGADATAARLERLSPPFRQASYPSLVTQLARTAPNDALRFVDRLTAGEARDEILTGALLPNLPAEQAVARIALVGSHNRRMQFLHSLCMAASDPKRLHAAELALARLKTLATPADTRTVESATRSLLQADAIRKK